MSPPNKQDILSFLRHPDYRPARIRELARAMQVPQAHYRAFRRLVDDMVKTGEVIERRRKRFAAPESAQVASGYLHGHQGGFGYVTLESDEDDPDVFIARHNMGQALHGDRVQVRLYGRRRGMNPEGEIIRVLERGREPVVGTYHRERPDSYVIPDDPRIPRNILIPLQHTMDAETGHKVVAHITDWEKGSFLPQGQITEVLGFPNDPGMEIMALIRSYDLPVDFPDPVIEEAEEIPVIVAGDTYEGRLDLRRIRCFTIDPATARDFDDAVSIETLPDGGWRLGVHIADVSAYVPEGSLIDREAMYRGTSVYLVDRVIPMLPHRLTNQICSLVPDEDRLTMTVFMEIDADGDVARFDIQDSVIRSARRLTYEEAQDLIDRGNGEPAIVSDLRTLRELSKALLAQRVARGSLDFDLPEPLVLLDEAGAPLDVRKEERLDSHRLIEECMLAANRTVAGYLLEADIPAVYRVHDKPDAAKLADLQALLAGFGYSLAPEDVAHPKKLQRFLASIKDQPDHLVINDLVVRSMKKAQYTVNNIGHYGLAFDRYTHFTSPIRRYPDLIVHRLVRELRTAPPTRSRLRHLDKTLPKTADIASRREVIAERAERESVKIKQIEYMEQHLEEEYTGVISGVVAIGLFVELEDSLIDGLVHVASLADDHYRFDPDRRYLMGERNRRLFRLGDRVLVRVIRADRRLRRIDFELIDHTPTSGRRIPASLPPRKTGRTKQRSARTAPGRRSSPSSRNHRERPGRRGRGRKR